MSFLYLIPFFIAAAAVGVYLEWRSARMDRKAAGLKNANRCFSERHPQERRRDG